MYTFIKNPIHFEVLLFTKMYWMTNNFVLSLLQIKHQLFHLCHTYFRALYEMHSATFLQQLSNIKGFKYFEHSK